MPIRILPPEVANQIAAGEVVERPASAVKELIENSLDAGAGEIRVEVRDGGRRLIRVQDDGCGIPAGEVHLAFQRHATSKIVSADDLSRITTLGFRGEALASLSAVAQVSLLTRTRDEEAGTLIRLAGGQEVDRSLRGTPPGTTVTVEHLFANVPARLSFLKQPATEAAHIHQVVTRYALAYPERRFSLVADGKLAFQSTGTGKLADVLLKVYGLEMSRSMLPLEEAAAGPAAAGPAAGPAGTPAARQRTPIRISGYTGAPALHRGSRGHITLFVNHRWFQDTSVAYAVIQAYHTMLPAGRFPVAVIFIAIDPAEVDVNVHPTKAEVRFREPGAVFAAVQRSVRATLTAHAPIPQANLGADRPAAPAWSQGLLHPGASAESWAERRAALLGAGGAAHPAQPPAGPEATSPPQPQEPRPALMPILRVVGQLAATYIVAEGPDGLYLIDQHAAHERVLYEQLMAEHLSNRLAVQPLLEPLLLDLSPDQGAVVAGELEALAEVGIEVEPFGGSSYLVRTMPAILGREDPAAALVEIVDGLAQQADTVEAARESRLVTLICKRAAVKGSTPMSAAEMQELVRRLEGCASPRTCPHGRPTMIYVSSGELARQFGRT